MSTLVCIKLEKGKNFCTQRPPHTLLKNPSLIRGVMKRAMVKISGTCTVPYIPMSPEAPPVSDGKALLKSAVRHKETQD